MLKKDIVKNLTDEELQAVVEGSINTNFYEIKNIEAKRLFKNSMCGFKVTLLDKTNDHETELTVVFDKDKVQTQTLYTGVFERAMLVGIERDYKNLIDSKFEIENEEDLTF